MSDTELMTVAVDGTMYSLKDWADKNHVSYGIVYCRWKWLGWRDPHKLIEINKVKKDIPINNPYKPITQDNLDWLLETRPYRKGQEDEWEIACDLIGQPHYMADTIRKAIMAAERKNPL